MQTRKLSFLYTQNERLSLFVQRPQKKLIVLPFLPFVRPHTRGSREIVIAFAGTWLSFRAVMGVLLVIAGPKNHYIHICLCVPLLVLGK
jgi:hypothetical protein